MRKFDRIVKDCPRVLNKLRAGYIASPSLKKILELPSINIHKMTPGEFRTLHGQVYKELYGEDQPPGPKQRIIIHKRDTFFLAKILAKLLLAACPITFYAWCQSFTVGAIKEADFPGFKTTMLININSLAWRDWIFRSDYTDQLKKFNERYNGKLDMAKFWNSYSSVLSRRREKYPSVSRRRAARIYEGLREDERTFFGEVEGRDEILEVVREASDIYYRKNDVFFLVAFLFALGWFIRKKAVTKIEYDFGKRLVFFEYQRPFVAIPPAVIPIGSFKVSHSDKMIEKKQRDGTVYSPGFKFMRTDKGHLHQNETRIIESEGSFEVYKIRYLKLLSDYSYKI